MTNIHNKGDIHLNFNKMKAQIFYSDYYWNYVTRDIKLYLDKCPICNAKYQGKKIQLPLKPIIPEGPKYRYVDDLW